MNVQPTPLFLRLTQVDQARGVGLKAYEEGGLLHKESELSLSEAAQKISQGQTVTLEEVSQNRIPVTYTQWGQRKEGVITLTQRERTHIASGEVLEQFVHTRAGDKPTTPLEELAGRFQPYEGHLDTSKQEVESLAAVKTGWLGGKKLSDGPGLSAFEAAQTVIHGGTVAITQLPVLILAQALLGGGGADEIKDHMKSHFISAGSDLDALALNRE